MSNWNQVARVDLETLASTRKALHQAVQIVGAIPRNLLPHDPTDTSASLEWNDSQAGLQSIEVPSNEGKMRVGLSIKHFSLYVLKDDQLVESLPMASLSTNNGLEWVQEQLARLGFDAQKINLKLPYEIESYDYSASLQVDQNAATALAVLYSNTNQQLSSVVKEWEKAFEIRCWPHHFDLATLIPVEVDDKEEILKSIGIGLSPGDEEIPEPYLYVNVWPNVDGLDKHNLPVGHWNQEGWSGAVLTYSQLLDESNQKESLSGFVKAAMQYILRELT